VKKVILFLILLCFTITIIYSQNSTGFGTRLNLSDKSYNYGNSANQTDITYKKPSFEIIGTNSIHSQNNFSKFSLGYTFEVGLSFFKFTKKETQFPSSSLWESDTVGYKFTEDFKAKKIHITNCIDFKYKINEKFTLINSIGLKIENKDGYEQIEDTREKSYIFEVDHFQDNYSETRQNKDVYNYPNNFPLNLKLIIIPQLQVNYKNFSMKIQIYQDVLNINNYFNPIDIGSINYTTFTGLGIVFLTKPKVPEIESDYIETVDL